MFWRQRLEEVQLNRDLGVSGKGRQATHSCPTTQPGAIRTHTLQPMARRAWSTTTVDSSAAATSLVSSRTTGQRANTSPAADRVKASAPKSHCSHGTGMSHRTWGDRGS